MGRMEQKADEVKGRVKEAAGDLTDDDELKREGKLDRAKSTVKEKAQDVSEKVEDVADDVGDKVKDLTGRRR